MKLWKTFLFEFAYQARRVSTWLYFVVLVFFAFTQIVGGYLPGARSGGYFLSAPFVIASVTVFCCLIWLLAVAYLAGDAAARDVETGMHSLTYTAPASKADYLGGRFLAAFVLNALILLAVPAGILLGLHAPEVEAEIRGPFRPAAYLAAYAFIALPNAFIGTAVQFSLATLGRRAVASFVGGVLLLAVTYATVGAVALFLDRDVGQWLDPIGVVTILSDNLTSGWTPNELNTRVIWLEGSWLASRLLWLGIALATLAFTHFRFRFSHHTATTWWSRIKRRPDAHSPAPLDAGITMGAPISVPQVRRTFDLATRAGQTLAIVWEAFAKIAKTWISLVLLAVVALFALASVAFPELMGVPLLPRTDYVLFGLQNPGFPPGYLIIPLLIVYWSGELVWREREARLNELVDAAPVPDWVLFLGRFLGLGLLLAVCMAIRMAAGILVQLLMGYHDFEIGLYLSILFGLQLADYLLLGLLALVVHGMVNQKHVGHLVTIVAFVFIIAAPDLGVHDLLAYGSDLGWSYTEMRGFGPSLGPWVWYKLYWAAWALLLAMVAKLLWVRGREGGLGVRLRIALRRFTPATAGTVAVAVGLIVTLGGFIFYNTDVLNPSETAFDRTERLAEYERRYGRYAGIAQPRLTGTSLEVEIYPERRHVEIRGTYLLVNDDAAPIDSVHLAIPSDVETGGVDFDRPSTSVLMDDDLGHRIYVLDEPLQPGDSLRLNFEVRFEPRGFPNSAVDASVIANGTYLGSQDWLPAIGYQRIRELRSPGDRQVHGLAPRPPIPSLYDVEARRFVYWAGRMIDFEAVVGTAGDQVAIAPGVLRETWTEGGRRYFRYATDAPIGNEYGVASAHYAVHEGEWNDVAIQIFHDPRHAENLDRVVQSVRASLDHYTEQFGPYPYSYIRLVERPGPGGGLHADAGTITYREWFSLMNPDADPGRPDVPFAVVAHEVGHQWWGGQLGYALVEGAGVLSESLAWYSAIGVVENTLGREEVHRLLRWMREPYPVQSENVPLLRAADDYLYYRKGPFAMYALREYVGEERVNGALRRLLEEHGSGEPPLPTTLDLYRELQAVTPDSLRNLLHDLFEANTFWELATERATADETAAGTWQVTLDVQARKVVVDTTGVETELPMDDWVEIGVFAPAEEGEELGEPIYLLIHRIRSTEQTITVTVPREPARAGIDPYHLLDWDMDDNITDVRVGTVR